MKTLRNKEIKKLLYIQIGITILSCLFVYYIYKPLTLFVLLICSLLIFIHYHFTLKRYKDIANLSNDINRLLHGNQHIHLNQYEEGELGILQSEIYKMTIRLKEQQQSLLDDKIYLSNSIADISHQIKTPLTSINLLISLLNEESDPIKKRKIIFDLYHLLSQIEWLVTTLLKISKLDAKTVIFQKEKISLEELINESLQSLLVPIELKNQHIIVKASGTYQGDFAWSKEALENIIKNCYEHTDFDGTITIEASENPIYSEIIISDNGKGIDQEDLHHIFERFYKGKNSSNKSYGIGLALARMIISEQNGTIKAENNKDGGARFIIKFYKRGNYNENICK